MEALQEEDKAEDASDAEARSEEPAGLTQGVHQKHADEHGNRTGECQSVIGAQSYQTGDFQLAQAEANQGKGAVEGDECPQTA